jgi:tRNA1Val (adenine37-N6)-methyltransferase
VISLVLARINPSASVVAVENNPEMAALVERNIHFNELAGRVSVNADDVISLRKKHLHSRFDLVVSNPPFRTAGSGKVSPLAGRDAARHETTAGLYDFLIAAKYMVKPDGRICFIQHPSRLTDFIILAGELKLALHRLRMVHDKVSAPATMFLAELAKGSRSSLQLLPPLIIRDESGEYSREAKEIFGDE